jgi:hypothetical protein
MNVSANIQIFRPPQKHYCVACREPIGTFNGVETIVVVELDVGEQRYDIVACCPSCSALDNAALRQRIIDPM